MRRRHAGDGAGAAAQPAPGRGSRHLADLALISGGAVLAQALALLSGPLVARMLGPDGRGELALVVVITRIAAVLASGGLPVAVAHAVGSAHAPARDVLAERLRRWMWWSLVPMAAATVAVLLVLQPGSWWMLAVPTAGIALSVQWNLVIGQMLRGEGSVRNVNVLSLSGVGTYTLGVTLLFVFHPTDHVVWVVLLLAASQLLSTAVGWRLLRPPSGSRVHRASDDSLGRFARQAYLSNVNPVTLGADQLLVGLLLGSADLGLYAAALTMTNLPVVILSGVASMLLPRMAGQPPAEQVLLMRRWLWAATGMNLATILLLQAVIDPAIRLLFGAEFAPAITCARLLILAWGVMAMRGLLNAAAQAQGAPKASSRIEAAALGVLVVVGVPAVQLAGINGMALAFALSGLVSCAWLARVIQWRVPRAEEGPAAAVAKAQTAQTDQSANG